MSLSGDRSHLEPGYRLDRYELLCPIAHGGMASVWLARLHGKHGFEKLVAVKTILSHFAADPRFQQMFLDEARIAAGIEHANVAQILDLGEQHEVLYLVMEWVDGDSLSKLRRAVKKHHATMPVGVVLRIIADTCAGLHAAHELRDPSGENLGVVHRDVSPQNILVSVNGAIKLIDFGIAKARDRVAGDTSAGLLKGKIQYMAPEQAIGKPVDRRSDVWAMGAVMYDLLTGAPPHDGPNQLATLHRLTSGTPARPLPKEYPAELDALCQSTLAHEPDARLQTAAELQHAIEALLIANGSHITSGDVATFARSHLGERAKERRKAVELALRASAERKRVQILLAPEPPDVTGQAPAVRSGSQQALAAAKPSPPNAPPRLATPASRPHGGAPLQTDSPSEPSSLRAMSDEPEPPSSQVTAGTLGSAVLPYSGSVGPSSTPNAPLTPFRTQHVWAVAIGVMGAAIFVAVFVVASLILRHRAAASKPLADTLPLRTPASAPPAPEGSLVKEPAQAPPEPAPKEAPSAAAPAAEAENAAKDAGAPNMGTRPKSKTAPRAGQRDYGF